MKQEVVAITKNVRESLKCVEYLRRRPKTEMVGLGLIYGPAGTGKTRFARRFAIQNNFIFIRLESTMTARSFVYSLFDALKTKFNISDNSRGSTNTIYAKCVEIINDIEDEVIIFIDEIDYAFKDKKLLGTIRDIVDETICIIILVGMQNAKIELLKCNSHYFDRCNYFVQYTRLNLKDVQLVCNELSEYQIDKDTIKAIKELTRGTLRQVVKLINACENVAKSKQLKEIKYSDVRAILEERVKSDDFAN